MSWKLFSDPVRSGTRERGAALLTILFLGLAPGVAVSQPRLEEIEFLVKQGRFAQAEQSLRSLTEPTGKTDYLLGFTLIQLYRFDEAEEALLRSVEDQPENLDRLHALAKSLLEQGKNLAAIEVLDRALAVQSRPDLFFARAMCALNVGRTLEAENDLEASLEGQARNPETLFKLGQLERDRGDYKAARARFAAVLEIAPNHLEATFSIAVAELRTGNVERAIEGFRKVLEAVPGHVGALYNLARALRMADRSAEAKEILRRFARMSAAQDEVDFLQKAVEKNPVMVDGRLALAQKLLEVGRTENALEEALVARQLDPRRVVTYRVLAEALKRLGRHADAVQAENFAGRLEAGS